MNEKTKFLILNFFTIIEQDLSELPRKLGKYCLIFLLVLITVLFGLMFPTSMKKKSLDGGFDFNTTVEFKEILIYIIPLLVFMAAIWVIIESDEKSQKMGLDRITDKKEKADYLKRFRQDLKICGIEPDYLIRIARDSWIIIDSKTYLPGEEALTRINDFEKRENLNKDQIQQAQEDINNWISLLVKSTSRMIKKGYLDTFEGSNFLWVVAPDRLVEYYLQKYSTIYLDEGILDNVAIPIKDTRAQLVSFSSLTWLLIDLKSRGFKSMAEADFHSNPEWYISLKTIIGIARDILEYNEEMMSKIVKTLDVLKEFESDFINNEFSGKLNELEALTSKFIQYFNTLEDTSFSPRMAGFQFIPPRKTKGTLEPRINLDSFL